MAFNCIDLLIINQNYNFKKRYYFNGDIYMFISVAYYVTTTTV